jgi:hypothetical protein
VTLRPGGRVGGQGVTGPHVVLPWRALHAARPRAPPPSVPRAPWNASDTAARTRDHWCTLAALAPMNPLMLRHLRAMPSPPRLLTSRSRHGQHQPVSDFSNLPRRKLTAGVARGLILTNPQCPEAGVIVDTSRISAGLTDLALDSGGRHEHAAHLLRRQRLDVG